MIVPVVLVGFPDLCVSDVAASVRFYRDLLDLDVQVDHGWYAELGAGGRPHLALVRAGHETVPPRAGGPPRGVLVSFEVDDATAVAERADRLGFEIVAPLARELGQLHVMLADADGTVVDVIERVALTTDDRRRLAGYRRELREDRDRADR